MVSVSSFPRLDLSFRNDSVCLFGFQTLSGNLGSSVFKKAAVAKNPLEGEAAAERCGQLFHLSSPHSGPEVMVLVIYRLPLLSEAMVLETATKTF